MNGHGIGKFALGMTAGMAAGAALGMTMAPSRRRVKRAAHKAAKQVSEAVETLTDAMGMERSRGGRRAAPCLFPPTRGIMGTPNTGRDLP